MIDFTRFLAGPACTQTLADLGAEVVKVEAVGGGDETRTYVPPDVDGESPYFLGLNRGKKSICLNLASAGGAEVARDLVRGADVVVEEFLCRCDDPPRPRLRGAGDDQAGSDLLRDHRLRVGYKPCRAARFRFVFQAESGLASLTGDPDRLPMRTGSPIIDIAAAMNAATAITSALFARQRTGIGQYVEVAMFDTAINLLAYFPMNYLASGVDPVRQGNTAPVATPVAMFETAEGGPLYVSCGSQKSWETLARDVLGRPELVGDPDYATNRDRNRNREALYRIISEIFLSKPRSHWIALARAGRVPIGAVRSVGEALDAPLARERRIVSRVSRPDGTEVPNRPRRSAFPPRRSPIR